MAEGCDSVSGILPCMETIHIVVAGRPNAGKSTLLNVIFSSRTNISLSRTIDMYPKEQHGINLKITYFTGSPQDKKTKNLPDLVLFCIPVGPSNSFDNSAKQLMKSLHRAYGKDIWTHCVVVFTFSNLAWEYFKSHNDAINEYKQYIKSFTSYFEQELSKLRVKADVITIFESTGTSKEELLIITTIPSGCKPQDPVLQGIQTGKEWAEVLFQRMHKHAKDQSKRALLKFQYGEEDDFIQEIDEAVSTNKKVEQKLAHGIFIGLPGAGKSSLMDRLLNRPRKEFSSSTNVSDPVNLEVDLDIDNSSTFHSVTVMDPNINETWKEVEYAESIVRQMGKDKIPTQSAASETTSIEECTASIPSPPPSSRSSQLSLYSNTEQLEATTSDIVRKRIRSIIEEYGGYQNFKCYAKKTFSLYLRDIGGQVEFQEMLPLLIFGGPSIFFFVFRLDLDFKEKFRVKYRKGVGESLNCYTSSITTEEAFLQCLASVYAMDRPGNDKTHDSLVFIVGTHKDKLGPSADAKIATLNQYLSILVKNSGFDHLVLSADRDKGHVMFTVDNTSDSEEDFKLIRSRVNSLVSGRQKFTVEYPISYLLFSLELQNVKCSVLSLDECKVMAAKYGIEEDQLLDLLQFLHLRIGTIRYFDKDGVRHIVIKEPQVLFNNATDLIVKTFSSDALTDREADDFKKKGILTASVLATAVGNLDITPEVFLQLLVHLRIATPFTPEDQDKEKKFFLPSVLNQSSEDDPKTDILPLAVKFKCEHCPKGLFGVLVTHLMNVNKEDISNTSATTFTLVQDKIFKNQVSFKLHSPGVNDIMALKMHPSHLEIKFFPDLQSVDRDTSITEVCDLQSEDRDTSITEVCDNVRQITERSIHQSLQDLHYSESRVDPVMCLRCEDCSELHPVEKEFKIYCKKTHITKPIPPQGQCWYSQVLTSDSARRYLRRLSGKAIKNVGQHLGLLPESMNIPGDMLSNWLRGADNVHEDSGTPSWENLAKALEYTGHKDVTAKLKKDLDLVPTVADKPATTPPPLTHVKVKRFLKPLTNADIRNVGLELGLQRPRLQKMKEDTLLDDMLDSWLREDDDVSETSGIPSWESLAKALEEAGYNGIAANIRKDFEGLNVI